MGLSLLAGVTVHGEDSALSYARTRLCERDFQIASNRIDFREIDAPVDEPVAVRTDATQVARQRAGGDAFCRLRGGARRGPVFGAKSPPRAARVFFLFPPLRPD